MGSGARKLLAGASGAVDLGALAGAPTAALRSELTAAMADRSRSLAVRRLSAPTVTPCTPGDVPRALRELAPEDATDEHIAEEADVDEEDKDVLEVVVAEEQREDRVVVDGEELSFRAVKDSLPCASNSSCGIVADEMGIGTGRPASPAICCIVWASKQNPEPLDTSEPRQ
ncbi:hypothetical protein HKX48_007799 [Thoreauomyces humboldtii]|nr:hypothetical protein HKX48_007799 [Thoreauomyces humboldtii]